MAVAFCETSNFKVEYPIWFMFQKPDDETANKVYGFSGVWWNHPELMRGASGFVVKPPGSPEQRTFAPSSKEIADTAAWVEECIFRLAPIPELALTCLVTQNKISSEKPLIDFASSRMLNSRDVFINATGWVGRSVPLLGRIPSGLLLNRYTDSHLSTFQIRSRWFGY